MLNYAAVQAMLSSVGQQRLAPGVTRLVGGFDEECTSNEHAQESGRVASDALMVSRNKALSAPAPNIGLSAIYSCRYLTFSNSQQEWQCQNVLTASHTVHLNLFTADISFLVAGAVGTVGGKYP